MNESDLIEKLAEAVAGRILPPVPRDIELWDFEAIAAYLRRSVRTVREDIAVLPSFPKPITLPTARGKAHPLYKAVEVIGWAESHQERKKAA
jgi:hypothetical protein